MVGVCRDPRASLLGHPRRISLFRILSWARSMALVPIPRFTYICFFLHFHFANYGGFYGLDFVPLSFSLSGLCRLVMFFW